MSRGVEDLPADQSLHCMLCGYDCRDLLECPSCKLPMAVVYIGSPEGRCRECELKHGKTGRVYTVNDSAIGTTTYNVELANSLVARINDPEVIEWESAPLWLKFMLTRLLQVNVIELGHLSHIPAGALEVPIIAATQEPPKPGLQQGLLLIDGSHRLAICLRDRQPIRIVVLSRSASDHCTISHYAPGVATVSIKDPFA